MYGIPWKTLASIHGGRCLAIFHSSTSNRPGEPDTVLCWRCILFQDPTGGERDGFSMRGQKSTGDDNLQMFTFVQYLFYSYVPASKGTSTPACSDGYA